MPRHGRSMLFALFAASGFAGLIYESIWTHYLKLFLGHAAYAQALVLALFMGGMALGAAFAGRRSVRWANLLRAYAWTEAAVGAIALAFHEIFRGATALAFDTALPALAGHPLAITALKWGLSAALILPQCVLLGMTFPLMTAGVLRAFPDRPGRSLAMLYFANSLGAAVGVLASGFLLVRLVGLPGTVRVAGAINLAVAALVLRLFARASSSAPAQAAARGRWRLDGPLALLLAVSFVTGASSFVYEVVWIRMLSLVLGASTHAFELMLSAFILGLALGGLFIQRRIDREASLLRTLALVQVAMGLFALGTLLVYGPTFDAMRWLVTTLPHTGAGYLWFNLASNGIALAVMLPATFCAGMTLPLITFRLLQQGYGEASIGAVYASNTVGAIAAVFFATHLGLPLLGMKGLLTFGAALDLGLGVLIAWAAREAFRGRLVPLALTAASAAAAVGIPGAVSFDLQRIAAGVYRTGRFLAPGGETVLSHVDGKTATVSVIADALGNVRISTNGKIDAAIGMRPGVLPTMDEYTMSLAALIPLALSPGAKTAACIGFGSGLTTHTLLSDPGLARVDTIEIEEEMVKGAERFRPRNERAYTDPRGRVHIEDAKTFFSTSGGRYDLIVSEPSNPWVSGVAGLFSDEFYEHAVRHLNPGAHFVQWIQLYEIDVDLVASVMKALGRHFSDYAVFAANDVDAIVVARNGGAVGALDLASLSPWATPALERLGMGVQDLAARRMGSRRFWEPLLSTYDIPANSDYQPVLDQSAARDRFLGVDALALLEFPRLPLCALEMLDGGPPPWERSAVTLAMHYEGSQRAWQATLLRDLALAGGSPQGRHGLGARALEEAAPFVEWRRRCAQGAPPAFPLQGFLSLAEKTVPWLTPAELAELWRPAQDGPCAEAIPAPEREWVAFIAAASARDGARTAAAARALLARPALAPQTRRYLVAAGMLGSLAQGDARGASQVWSTSGAGIEIGRDLLLRMLVARARAGG